jgi:Bacterial Ig-like domain (group 3)
MSSRLPKFSAGIGVGVVALVTLLAPVAAHATTQPPWEPDSNAAGTLTFYDSNGNVITSGSIADLPFAAYTVGSALPRSGDTSARLEFAQPNPSQTDPINWSTLAVSALTNSFPIPAAVGTPTVISSLDATHPVVKGSASDNTLEQDIFELPNTGATGQSFDGASGCAYAAMVSGCTNASYENIYQLRLQTYNGSFLTQNYDDADLLVDPVHGTWTQVYPAPVAAAVTTTTTVTTSPATSTSQGTNVTVTATIAASDTSKPAGTVQFKDNGVALGSPVAVDTTTETATYSSAALTPGVHSFTASFSPTVTTTYGISSGGPTTLGVNPVAAVPTVTGNAQVGQTLTCSEATSIGEAVTFAWKLNGATAASGRTYTLPAAAAAKSVTCEATVAATGVASSSATSTGKTVAEGAALKATKKPALSGKDKVGKTEKVSHGTWSPAASSYTYQWYLGSKKIKKATKSSYKLVKKDKGKKISVKVTAKKAGYASGTAATKALKVKK